MRHEPLLPLLVEVAQVLAAELHVLGQVVVAPVGDPLQLADAEREGVLDVGRGRRVEGQLLGVVVAEPEPVGPQAEVDVPLEPGLPPVGVPLRGLVGPAEELDLHLLELARAEGEVARVDLVAEALADLGDAERQLDAAGVDDVLEVGEDPLGGLGAEVGDVRLVLEGADVRLEHQVERPRLGQRAAVVGRGADDLLAVGRRRAACRG